MLHPLLQAATRRRRKVFPHKHANRERFLLGILTLSAFAIRTYKIGNDSRVVWDETHFGRFASNYINRKFYLDVHPPLGKLLITLVFWLSGYSGSFDFASGEHYPDSVPYVQVRCFQAAVGSLLVPSTFYLCRTLGFPLGAAWVAAILVVVDNALIGISRIIVLDPMLLLANSLLVIAFSRVLSASSGRPASVLLRFVWLGILVAVVCSIKLVGLLTVAVIGIYLLNQAFYTFANMKPLKKTRMVEDALVYIGTLVLLPTLLYTLVFWIHFSLLQTYTPHADNMGSAYSASLNGWALRLQPAHIHSSSFVTIRAAAYPFEYLCSKQYADSANSTAAITWLSSTRTFAIQDYLQVNLLDRERLLEAGGGAVADGSLVSLQAPKTDLYISVFPVYRTIDSRGLYVDFAEQNTSNTKIAAFGATRSVATKETAAKWRIKEVSKRADDNASDAHEIMPIVSRFRLVSPENNNCELSISRSLPLQSTAERRAVFLPEYSLECVPKGGVTWTIEHQIARSDRPMAEIPPHAVKPSLLTTTVAYNLLMREINGMLRSDPDQHVPVESAPASWPFLNRPMRMVGAWTDETQPKYLLVGNFLVWWVSGFVCTFVHPTLVCLHWIISKRSGGRVLLLLPEDSRKTSMLWVLWAAHYLVFFGMSRTTYLHHYLPALYFAVILAALYVYRLAESASDVLLTAVSGPFTPSQSACCKRNVLAAFVVAAVVVSWLLAPVTFGTYKPCSFRILRYIPALDQQLC